jgi:hypothetical protein
MNHACKADRARLRKRSDVTIAIRAGLPWMRTMKSAEYFEFNLIAARNSIALMLRDDTRFMPVNWCVDIVGGHSAVPHAHTTSLIYTRKMTTASGIRLSERNADLISDLFRRTSAF